MTAMSDKCLPAGVKLWDAMIAGGDQKAIFAAQNDMREAFTAAANGKKVAPVDVMIGKGTEVTKQVLAEDRPEWHGRHSEYFE